jgi:hypothetical protein
VVSGQRKALIVANDSYEQEALRDLVAPAADAEALGQVLGDRQIGEFTVQVVRNQPSYVIQAQIEELFLESLPDDVLLLHFSGHGLKNQSGELYFAASNTRPKLLGSTAVPADFVQRCMRASRSRSIVLFLDCCYGGAFAQGVAVRAAGDINVLDSFPQERGGGRGRAVITASNAMEYAFEGDQLADNQQPRPSVFTAALVEGLATGDADRDEDGWVSLNELYDYVFEKVRVQNPHQTPSRDVEMQGELYVARSKRRRIHPAPLPPGLAAAMADPNLYMRLGAVSELGSRVTSDDLPMALGAYEALAELARTDSEFVARPAAEALSVAALHPEQATLNFGECPQGSEPPHRTVRLLGPPIARFCTPHASGDWIQVTETAEGFDVAVDTSGMGSMHGSFDLKGPAGQAVIAVEVQLIAPAPDPPAVPAPEPPAAEPAGAEPAPAPAPRTAEIRRETAGQQLQVDARSVLILGRPVHAVAFSPDCTRLATGGRGIVRVWGLQPTAVVRDMPIGRRATVSALAFSPDGARLAGAIGQTARIWNLSTGEQELEVTPEASALLAVAFSPDGTRLAGAVSPAVWIWDASTGEQQLELTPRGYQVQAVGFSPDGARLATGSDGFAQVWDAASGHLELAKTDTNYSSVFAVAFSPDGSLLAAGGSDRSARIWDIAAGPGKG